MPAETIAAAEAPAVYGKLPARGDFITRRIGRPFVDAWDSWLQEAITATREALGERWLDFYLTSPVWRFALGANCCGPNSVFGVVMPSVDRVGRYFPLMLGRELPPGIELMSIVTRLSPWYQEIEDRALAALTDAFQLEDFERPLDFVPAPPFAAAAEASPLLPPGHYMAADPVAAIMELSRLYGPLPEARTVWWTSGSEHVKPCILLCPGMPQPAAYTSLYDGGWEQRGWITVTL